jgi:hypothetical protein
MKSAALECARATKKKRVIAQYETVKLLVTGIRMLMDEGKLEK